MSNVLPVIEMPAKEPEPEPVKPEVGTAKENVLPETGDGNMDIIDQLQEKKVEFEDNIITVDEREVPSEDEVFTERPAPKMKPIVVEEEEALEIEELPNGQPNEFEPARKGKRKYVRKAPMSEKQKEHLARIRQIAIEKRKAEKERKQKEKEEAVIEKAEKKILEKKKKEEEKEYLEQKKQQELINNPPQQTQGGLRQKVVQQNGFTKEDLLLWAIRQNKAAQKANCRLYEARKLNNDDILEKLPFYCMPKDTTILIDEAIKEESVVEIP